MERHPARSAAKASQAPKGYEYKARLRGLSNPKQPPKGGFVFVALRSLRRFSRRACCRALSLIAAAILALYATFTYTHAQSGNSAGWSQLGALPPSTYDVAIDGNTPPTLYALAQNGLSSSADMGKTWKVCDPEARSMRLVSPPGADRGAPTTIYTTGALGPRLSADGCATWQTIPAQGILPAASNVRLITAHPLNPRSLFAGMNGLGGLYRSTDSGTTWQPASQGLPPGAWVTAITVHPLHTERVFVGVRYTTRDHPSAYVFESGDAGLTWRSVSLGLHVLPGADAQITGLAWAEDKLFAATSSDGLYAYSEQTRSWSRAKLPPREQEPQPTPTPNADGVSPLPLSIKWLASNTEGALLINTPRGIFRSLNKATTWERFEPNGVSNPDVVAMDPNSERILLAIGDRAWGYSPPAKAAQPPAKTLTPQTPRSPSAVAQVALTPPPGTEDTEPTPPPTPLLPTSTLAPIAPTTTPAPHKATTTPPPRSGYVASDPAQPLDPSFSAFFPQTQHNIQHGFRDYWLNNDGLRLLGYPLTEEFVENGMTVQYFERGRLEYKSKADTIQWGRLGAELTQGQFFQTVRFFVSTDNNAYFGPTQHSVSGPFLKFWRDNGDLSALGYPLSESFKVGRDEYQWFERGRIEWHSDFPEDNRVILGQLGREALQKRGWIK